MVRHVQFANARILLWMLILSLAAMPVLAAEAPPLDSKCAERLEKLAAAAAKGTGSYRPLEMEQRLFYSLKGLNEGSLEIRYLVRGELWLSEVIDLAKIELPKKSSEVLDGVADNKTSRKPSNGILRNAFANFGTELKPAGGTLTIPEPAAEANERELPQVRGKFLEGERVAELLARNPVHVRELHKMFGEGTGIDIEVFHSGKRLEVISFDDLVARSADLRERMRVPVVVLSDVRGPGIKKKPGFSIITNDYLECCCDCNESVPCETECGYDPGKGGPVTCREQGLPCQETCFSSTPYGQYYSNWYFYGSGYSGYGICFVTEYYPRWHEEYVWVYRRDLIQRTLICPNAPSCDGCYVTEEVVGYQYTWTGCYARTSAYCSPAYMPCCNELCTVFPGIPCSEDWPC